MAHQQQSAFTVPTPYRVTESQSRHVLKIRGNSWEQEKLFYVEGPAVQPTFPRMVATEPWSDTPTLRRILLARLNILRETPAENRFPGADWPTPHAFDEAERFIGDLPLATMRSLPAIYAAHDGEVNFLWKNNDLHVDLGFYGDGTYSYYARGSDGRELMGDDLKTNQGLDDELVKLLTT